MSKESRKKVRISELNFKNIGDRITFIRMMHGNTVEEFSSMLGISKGNLSDLENNKNKPSYEVIACIAENFNVNSEWIISGTGKLFKRVYPAEADMSDYEMIQSVIGTHFEQRDLAVKIFTDALKLEKLSSHALSEVSDFINEKMKNILKSGERRMFQRRELSEPEKAPEGRDRRSEEDRRLHESYRKEN